MRSLGTLLVATWSAGCLVNPGAYRCEDDVQCVFAGDHGTCEQGYCAFEDPECDSDMRYHEHAPQGIAGECVETTGTSGETSGVETSSGDTSSTGAETGDDPQCGPPNAIMGGADHACVVRGDGGVVCWGSNAAGELAQGDVGGTSATPVSVMLPASVVPPIVGARHVCVALEQGGVACWGSNGGGQADPTRTTLLPVAYAVEGVPQLSAGLAANLGHTCGVFGGESVWCWGNNDHGELGAAGERGPFELADRGPLPNTVDALAVGQDHSCALAQGGVYCWGRNAVGQLGVEGADSTIPVEVPLAGQALEVSAGFYFSCANVEIAGDPMRVQCWGSGDLGQLGNGGLEDSSMPVEAQLMFAPDDTAIASVVARTHGVAIVTDRGRVYAWGQNRGEKFGAELGTEVTTPVEVAAALEVPGRIVDIGHGSQFICALTDAGRVFCWGSNGFEQLGPLADGDGGPFEVVIPCD